MDPTTVVILVLIGLFVLLAMRMPVAVALLLLSVIGIWAIRGPRAAMSSLAGIPYEFAAHWSLSAIPMFLLMGAFAHRGGLTSSLFKAARLWLGALPGGLAVATNVATAMFSSASGSSLATTAAMSRLAGPEMLKAGYAPSLATSVIAASGTIGALIPPSILFIVYGWYTEQPIGQLLMAGLLPGILTAAIYCVIIVVRCMLDPSVAPRTRETSTWSERVAVLAEIWPVPLLIVVVMGSIYTGLATATEAAAIGSIATIAIIALRGQMTLEIAKDALLDALRSSASVFFIAMGASLFANLIAVSGIPHQMGMLIEATNLTPGLLLAIFIALYLVLGMFLDPIGIMLITLPILLPAFNAMEMNLIWIGVLVVKMIEIGLITPPVGLNVFIVKGVLGDQVKLMDIFRGVTWFLLAEIVIVALLIAFPAISLFLPSMMAD
ncbi:MAG: TRAP transporter large permease [Pseudochelatococcus sp.]|jgi:C4-dicarboxylate transporter DctM subunit|uniref:TRAP transporter large permease n=1 Tax=Pseudochelatococcus sp. TaxID=2020869 RepID=UPI003D9307DD